MIERGYGQRVAPDGLLVESIEETAEILRIFAHGRGEAGLCPECGTASKAVRSFYDRRLADLPAHGRRVFIQVPGAIARNEALRASK